jgi:DnaK suppressor protein
MDQSPHRKRIQEEMEELRSLSDGSRDSRAPVELDQQSVGRLSRMDAMQQQSMDLAREERRRQRLAILAAALRRMDEDEYGYCLSCGDDIAAARLAADPAATLCLDCQRGR